MTVELQIPDFYNDLELSLSEAFRLLETGATNRRSPAHTPIIATLDASGGPSQRVMILRHCDRMNRTLRFHTDGRSTKVSALQQGRVASVLVYDPDAKIQLRLSGIARIEINGADVDKAWQQSTLFARRCYMAQAAPGALSKLPMSGLPDWIEGRQPNDVEIAAARSNFAILVVEFDSIEWLYLANAGHRRARWDWRNSWQGSWLVP